MPMFHLNPHTKSYGRCNAEAGNCPFGTPGDGKTHFPDIRSLREAYEASMLDRELPTISKKQPKANAATEASGPAPSAQGLKTAPPPSASEALLGPSSYDESYGKAQAEADKYAAQVKALNAQRKLLYDTGGEEVTWTPAYHRLVLEAREAFFKQLAAEKTRYEALTPVQRVAFDNAETARLAAMKARKEAWKEQRGYNKPYNYHPEITSRNEAPVLETVRVFSGRPEEELKAEVARLEASGLTKTEAYRHLWATVEQRKDKPFVYIDLECAAAEIDGKVDTGRYSNIIEVGYAKHWPDGRVEEDSFLCDVPEAFKATGAGTGAEHIHHISPSDVEGKPVFATSASLQKKMLEVLQDSVLVAHNASYEDNQFKYNLFGYREARAKGSVEVLDTRQVCMSFIPESENNSNRGFVEATGGTYGEGAHRALYDANKSREAFEIHRAKITSKA